MDWISPRHTAEEGNACPLTKQPSKSDCQVTLQGTEQPAVGSTINPAVETKA